VEFTDLVDQHLRETMGLLRFRVAYLVPWKGVEHQRELTIYAQTASAAEQYVMKNHLGARNVCAVKT
jgi:hypothetical protein